LVTEYAACHESFAHQLDGLLDGYYAIMAERMAEERAKIAAAQVSITQAWSAHLRAFANVAAETKAEISKEEEEAVADIMAMYQTLKAARKKLKKASRRQREDPAECGRVVAMRAMAEFRARTGMAEPSVAPVAAVAAVATADAAIVPDPANAGRFQMSVQGQAPVDFVVAGGQF
jgi:hypothetical protein